MTVRQAEALSPDVITPEAGLAVLRGAVDRLKTGSRRAGHPFLGPLSVDEWTQFHLRHAEMHVSFAAPESAT
ncbi:MAG TPA: DUF1569 domain-containing protein [Mycobacterium sp.]|jgi:hypothetical protein